MPAKEKQAPSVGVVRGSHNFKNVQNQLKLPPTHYRARALTRPCPGPEARAHSCAPSLQHNRCVGLSTRAACIATNVGIVLLSLKGNTTHTPGLVPCLRAGGNSAAVLGGECRQHSQLRLSSNSEGRERDILCLIPTATQVQISKQALQQEMAGYAKEQ